MNEKKENIESNSENVKYSIFFIILILFVLFLGGKYLFLNEDDNSNDDNSIILEIGEDYSFENDTSELTWNSSDDNIVTVDENGNVYAKNNGIVTILAYDGDTLMYEYTIEVVDSNNSDSIDSSSDSEKDNNNKDIVSIGFKNKDINLSVNDTYDLKLNVILEGDDLSKISWTSSNKSAITIKDGVITAVGKGTSTITASIKSGLSATCNITVSDTIKVDNIQFSISNISIYAGERYQSEIKFTPSNVYSEIKYVSSNNKIATVSDTGLITGVSEGDVVITASAGGVSTKLNVKILKKQTNKTVTVNFNNNGASKISSTKEQCTLGSNGCKITFPSITRSGYQIVGWSKNINSTVAEYKPGEKVVVYGDGTYYAITSKTLTVTFNSNRATISKNSVSCNIYNTSSSCTIQTPTISRTNYTILGWGTSADAGSTVTSSGGNLSMSSSGTYYAITKINVDGVEAGCTGWMATSNYYYSSASTSSSRSNISVGTAFTIEELVGDYFKVTIPNVSGYKYVLHKHVMINLSDYIPSMTFEISNASSSIYKSSGYSISNVTGQKLYSTGRVYNVRLRRNEYMAPILYSAAKKLLTAQKKLSSQGYSIKVYDTYRPRSVSTKIYNALSILYNNNSTVKSNIQYSYGASGTRYTWGTGWFLAPSLSTHNTGSAIDMTLVYKSNGREVAMPTEMHELSTKAIKYYSPNVAKTPANYSKEMNDAAKVMDNAATSAGLSTLSSEWWHFQDADAHSLIKGVQSNGCDFSVIKVYSY